MVHVGAGDEESTLIASEPVPASGGNAVADFDMMVLPAVPPLPGTVAGRRPSGKGRAPGPPPASAGKGATPPGSAVASREPSPMRKGKGKGSPPAPRPSTQGKGKSRNSVADGDENSGGKRLVNFHYRNSVAPKEEEVNTVDDSYINGMVAHLDMSPRKRKTSIRLSANFSEFEKSVGFGDVFRFDSNADADCDTPQCSPSPSPAPRKESDLATPVAGCRSVADLTPLASPSADTALQTTPTPCGTRRARRNTVFCEESTVAELSQRKLEEFFQVKAAAIDCRPRASVGGAGAVRTLISDPKHLQLIDILVKKEAILSHPHLKGQKSVEAAVESLVSAFRACDYKHASPQALEDIRKVTVAHLQDQSRQTILQFVERHGEEKMDTLEHPHLHRLLYGALRIPAINVRLECMVTEATKEESLGHCRTALETLHAGLLAISGVLHPLGSFFAAARQLGNKVNQDSSNSSAAVSGHGFKMSSLVKLLECKSHMQKEISLFHFALLLMPAEEVAQMCESSAIEDLQRAKAARSFTVYQVCMEFFDDFQQIRKLVETGKYKDKEIPADLRIEEAERVLTIQIQILSDNRLHVSCRSSESCVVVSFGMDARIAELESSICDEFKWESMTFHHGDVQIDAQRDGLLKDYSRLTVKETKLGSRGDGFFEKMKRFVEKTQPEVDRVQQLCHEVFETYRSFAAYFDDRKCFWPPPAPNDEAQASQGQEDKKDFFEFCHWVLTSIRQASKDATDLKLEPVLQKIRLNAELAYSEKALHNEPPHQTVSEIKVTEAVADQLKTAGEIKVVASLAASAADHFQKCAGEIKVPEVVGDQFQKGVGEQGTLQRRREVGAADALGSLKERAMANYSAHSRDNVSVPYGAASPERPKAVAAAVATSRINIPKTIMDLAGAGASGKAKNNACLSPMSPRPRAQRAQASDSHPITRSPPLRRKLALDEEETMVPRGSPTSRSSPQVNNATAEVDETAFPKGPPPNRKVVAGSPTSSPRKGATRSGSTLMLPGVARAGTPIPQSSDQGARKNVSSAVPVQATAGGNATGSSGDTSGRSSNTGSPPSTKERKFRRSVTSFANKAERQGIRDFLAEDDNIDPLSRSFKARDELSMSLRSCGSPCRSRSPSPSSENDENLEPASGFSAQIREGARKNRHSLELLAEELMEGGANKLSPRRVSRRFADHNASKYALSPVFEQGSEHGSNSATPAKYGKSPELSTPPPVFALDRHA